MNKNQLKRFQGKISGFSRVNFYQYSDFSKNEPTGVFCSSFSDISKEYVMERVREVIKTMNKNFIVSEDGLTNTHHFVIRFHV